VRGTARVLCGDCLTLMRDFAPGSFDAVITDPPAGIGFMGKGWDSDRGGRDAWIDWMAGVAAQCLRVLKPGAHALVWSLPRTSHWTATAWENGGWIVRDRISHIFGSGFPKSADVSKMLDKAAGVEREVTSSKMVGRVTRAGGGLVGSAVLTEIDITAPATPAAKLWQGWGTALKPAVEDWWLLRKPLEGTVAANVLKHGTGGLNIDGCRIGTSSTPRKDPRNGNLVNAHMEMRPWMQRRIESGEPLKGDFDGTSGRFPAHLILDEEAARLLDEQSGELHGPGNIKPKLRPAGGFLGGIPNDRANYPNDFGGASRFFYCAKASRAEREEGLEGCEVRQPDAGRDPDAPGGNNPRNRGAKAVANSHPTVKPLALMRWLVRLVTPPGGTVLDCFAGSGSTGVACVAEGFDCVGIEKEVEYAAIARKRIAAAQRQGRLGL